MIVRCLIPDSRRKLLHPQTRRGNAPPPTRDFIPSDATIPATLMRRPTKSVYADVPLEPWRGTTGFVLNIDTMPLSEPTTNAVCLYVSHEHKIATGTCTCTVPFGFPK